MWKRDKAQETIIIEKKSHQKSAEQLFEERWDIKKISIGLLTLALVIASAVLAKKYILPAYTVQNSSANVKGAQTQIVTPSTSSASAASYSLDSLKQQVQHINVNDIAKSSPQIQQILHQIETLPMNKAKEACIQLCNRL